PGYQQAGYPPPGYPPPTAYAPPGYVPYPPPPPPPPPPQNITVNVFSGIGAISAEYERAVASHLSLFIGPAFAYGSASSNGMSSRMYGLGGTAGLRLFFSDRAPEGGWFSPVGSVFRASAEFANGDRASATGATIAGLFGYTWIWGSGF